MHQNATPVQLKALIKRVAVMMCTCTRPINDGLDNDSDGTAAAAMDGVDTDSDGMGNDSAYEISPGNRMVTSLAAPGTHQAADDTPPPRPRRQHGFYSITHEHAQAAPETADDAATPARPAQSRPRARIQRRD
jgi:hypothetical protein